MLEQLSTVAIVVCWMVYFPLFFGRSGPGTERKIKDPISILGIVFQSAAVGVVWAWRRPLFSPWPGTALLRIVAPAAAVVLAIGSVYFSWLSLKTLGKHWSLVAGVAAEHRLVREGPYAVVRHPLYICFFGLTLAFGIVWTEPAGLAAATVLFWIGVLIRVRSEEKILAGIFGREFAEYRRRVPAYFPLGFGKEK